jgi:hypothetical protein
MAETEFREQGKKRPLSTTATQERGQVSTRPSWSGERDGKGRGGCHVTEDITKNLTRKIRHGYCETAE